MSDIRKELVRAAINRAYALIDYSVYNNAHKEYEFKKQTIIDDESLTDDEKSEAIEILTGYYDELLKRLDNVENANQSWFEEAKSHLTISNKWGEVVQCYGLTQDPLNGRTPLEYKNLMKQCWDADSSKRPDTDTLWKKISGINLFYQSKSNESLTQREENNYLEIDSNINSLKNYMNSTSKLHQFENLPEPRNATEEELEAFYSKPYNFYIPDNIDDFGKSVNQRDSDTLINKDNSKILPQVFNELQINSSKTDVQNNYYREEIMQQQRKNIDIDDEVQNNPNLHSEEQEELEIPDNI
ncbi:kinase-like domain-containing protein [Rhizophagus irregularis DAOM 181602=DAOM 197198]|nr:kinase-like domain-containing protein [Rhizophagus irregularis DAOM 181602=DAOM 197198]